MECRSPDKRTSCELKSIFRLVINTDLLVVMKGPSCCIFAWLKDLFKDGGMLGMVLTIDVGVLYNCT